MEKIISHIVGGEEASIECPNCHSKRIWKDGLRETRQRVVQRYLCRECFLRFSRSSDLSRIAAYDGECQVCDLLTGGSKNFDNRTAKERACGSHNRFTERCKRYVSDFDVMAAQTGLQRDYSLLRLPKVATSFEAWRVVA
jgi:transposase-like protein